MPPKYATKSNRGRGSSGRRKVKTVPVEEKSVADTDPEELTETDPPAPDTVDKIPEAHESGDESDVSSMAGIGRKDKRVKLVSDLSPENKQEMVEWLQANPIFYNKKMTSYKETGKKE